MIFCSAPLISEIPQSIIHASGWFFNCFFFFFWLVFSLTYTKSRFYVQTAAFGFELTSSAFYVYCYLCKCANKDGFCFPNRNLISKNTGLCKSSISKAISELVEKKLITSELRYQPLPSGNRRQTSNLYQVLDIQSQPNSSRSPVFDFGGTSRVSLTTVDAKRKIGQI